MSSEPTQYLDGSPIETERARAIRAAAEAKTDAEKLVKSFSAEEGDEPGLHPDLRSFTIEPLNESFQDSTAHGRLRRLLEWHASVTGEAVTAMDARWADGQVTSVSIHSNSTFRQE